MVVYIVLNLQEEEDEEQHLHSSYSEYSDEDEEMDIDDDATQSEVEPESDKGEKDDEPMTSPDAKIDNESGDEDLPAQQSDNSHSQTTANLDDSRNVNSTPYTKGR